MNVIIRFAGQIKIAAALSISAIASAIGIVGQMWALFLILMVFDFISAILSAAYRKSAGTGNENSGISSQKAWKGIIKKVFYVMVITLAFLFDIALRQLMAELGIVIPWDIQFGTITLGWFILSEFISILENITRADEDAVPKWLSETIKAFKTTFGKFIAEKVTDKINNINEE